MKNLPPMLGYAASSSQEFNSMRFREGLEYAVHFHGCMNDGQFSAEADGGALDSLRRCADRRMRSL
jgi:hypothetical protein